MCPYTKPVFRDGQATGSALQSLPGTATWLGAQIPLEIQPEYIKLYLSGLLLERCKCDGKESLNKLLEVRKRPTNGIIKSQLSSRLHSKEVRLAWPRDLSVQGGVFIFGSRGGWPRTCSALPLNSHSFIHSTYINWVITICFAQLTSEQNDKQKDLSLSAEYWKILKGFSCQHVAN